MMQHLRFFLASVACLWFAGTAAADDIPMIDAHSQIELDVDIDFVIAQMDKAGVARTILSTRGRFPPNVLATYARRFPDRITAAVRTKGNIFTNNSPKFRKFFNAQVSMPEYTAMAEVILWHAKKGHMAPEQITSINTPQAQMALRTAVERGWPFIFHYEFAAAGDARGTIVAEMEETLRAHPDHPFALIHMGQLDAAAAARLLAAHGNLHFMVSHANPIASAVSGQPWTEMFDGDSLSKEWREVIENHPDRFVLNFDNVFPDHWGNFYLKQAALWQGVLNQLPPEIGHAIGHGNAERLWKLPKVGS
ncbi:MAG: amidohydrolase family protein [Alphaproteobacteria bacterium]